jgi:hypothetical protein
MVRYSARCRIIAPANWRGRLMRIHSIGISSENMGQATGLNIEVTGLCVHSMRATAATNALSHEADIAKVQEWLGHANVSTTRLYDRRKNKPEDSPTFECGIKHQTLNKRRTIPLSAKSSRRAHQPARSVVLRRATRMPYP